MFRKDTSELLTRRLALQMDDLNCTDYGHISDSINWRPNTQGRNFMETRRRFEREKNEERKQRRYYSRQGDGVTKK